MSVIEAEALYKTYFMDGGLEHPVLKDVSFRIEKGEFVTIMGQSGSGKSTLMNILGCLDRPTAGKYSLAGKDVSLCDDDGLAQLRNSYIGFVFQGFNLLMKRNISDNVSLPLVYAGISESQRRKRSIELLRAVGLDGYEDHFPNQLSGGMQQRVAVARALANSPQMILADEPTGNLDTKTSDEIMRLFQDLNENGITIILVTHEHNIALYAKRLIRITDGRKEYDGLVKEYMEHEK